MLTGVTEHLAEEFRRTIDDGRLPGEPVGRRHESDDLDDADDRVDSDKVVDRGNRIEGGRALPPSPAPASRCPRHLPETFAPQRQLTVDDRAVARRCRRGCRPYRRLVGGQRCDDRREAQAQLRQARRPGSLRSHRLALRPLEVATCCSPVGPGSTLTSSHPSAPPLVEDLLGGVGQKRHGDVFPRGAGS